MGTGIGKPQRCTVCRIFRPMAQFTKFTSRVCDTCSGFGWTPRTRYYSPRRRRPEDPALEIERMRKHDNHHESAVERAYARLRADREAAQQ